MKNLVKVAFLTSITTAAIVYVLLEWRPLRSAVARAPEVTWAEPGAAMSPAPPTASPALADDADEQNNIEIYKKYSHAVVNIASTALAHDFFLNPYPIGGTGSGAILDTNGHIVTNFHVIEPALNGDLEVTLFDKSKYEAEIKGVDPGNDLAVIKIAAPREKLSTILQIGNSSGLLEGQKVLAIGNPYGLERTMTTGIISALGRSIEASNGRIIENIIQTDAAINPGNSGGPLLNRAGQIIGINTAIVSPTNSGNVGIGFAVPADTVRRVVNDLITHGYVRRPYVGVEEGGVFPMEGYPPALSQQLGIPQNKGFMVLRIRAGSPAARAGLRAATQQVRTRYRTYPVGGDILIGFEGKPIESVPELAAQIDRHKAGEQVKFTILRDGKQMDLQITLGETPRPTRAAR